jgi:DNA ligase-1
MSHQNFEHLHGFIRDLRATSSTIDKVNIIKDYAAHNNEGAYFIKQILLYTYHPLWQYNVTSDNLKKKSHLRGHVYESIFDLLNALKNRTITGHDAIGAVNTFIDNQREYEELIHCIIDKDLKTRAGDKLINKALPDFIPTFSVALADKYVPKIVNWKDGWYASRKIDGARCIAIVDDNGNSTFYSRTGKVFDTLNVVHDAIRSLGLVNVVLDGELCLVDEDGVEDFQGVMKELRKKDHIIPNPVYKIFDLLTHDEFYSQKGSNQRPFSIRIKDLEYTLYPPKSISERMNRDENSCLKILEQTLVKDESHFQELVKEASNKGWEGLMLRADEPYKGKRSKDLLKYKTFFDDEYTVEDVSFGPFRYVKDGRECEEIMLSNITIEHKGYKVDVGSGFTIEERQAFYKDKSKILNKTVTIQYFEETENQEGGISLRFPTLKMIHGDERDI